MGCVPCGSSSRTKTVYAWTNGTASKTYTTEAEAQRRKNRDGGNYKPVAG